LAWNLSGELRGNIFDGRIGMVHDNLGVVAEIMNLHKVNNGQKIIKNRSIL
jgi:hypothetical protein